MAAPSPVIRDVGTDDFDAIAAIYAHYVADTDISFETRVPDACELRRRAAEVPHGLYIVAETHGSVVGYAYAHPWKERAAYAATLETTVYVDGSFTGRGIGRVLMSELVERCRSHGSVHALIACITATNTTSRRLHERLGFTQVSHFKAVGRKGGDWLDVVDYELIVGENS